MSNFMHYKLLDACGEEGCPVCRLERYYVERHLENQFYENVNSPNWRDKLRGSLGFCREHTWMAVNQRLGDPLGFSIIYRDVLKSILDKLERGTSQQSSSHHRSARRHRGSEQARTVMENLTNAITPVGQCPVCVYRQETTRAILAELAKGLDETDLVKALQLSDGLCLPHLQQFLTEIKDSTTSEKLFAIQRGKMEGLKAELEEFIRKSDYREIQAGFGREGDAWLRTVSLVAGGRKG